MISKLVKPSFLGASAAFSLAVMGLGQTVSAQEVDLGNADAIANYAEFAEPVSDPLDSMGQVTNVNQIRDVSPTDWAYEALRSLVDRYGCISGFPNQTFRGNEPLSRYEFAAGLNNCLNQLERLIASTGSLSEEDLATSQRLAEEFEAELATIGGRLDNIEARTAFLEDNSFSTTSKLVGEVAFTLANAFGDENARGEDLESEFVFTDKVRLQLVSSFTGKDKLFTRLTAGNIANSFQDETGTREGRFAHDGAGGNNVTIDRLHYTFPFLNENLKVTAMAVLGAHHFYAETFNSGLNTGGGATGALTRFGERSPIYRLGIATTSAGVGVNYQFNEKFEVSAGYIAPGAALPDEERGLFDGSFSAMGQLVVKPIEKLKIGATYVRAYDPDSLTGRPPFLWGGTGTNIANDFGGTVGTGVLKGVSTNSFGGQVQFDVTPRLSFRGWFSYTDANLLARAGGAENGDATILNYAGAVVVSDLLKEGSMAALIVGAEPYVSSLDRDGDGKDAGDDNDGGDPDISQDIPIHVEALYKYQLNDNISITPGVVYLVNPNQDDNGGIFIGSLRTTFSF